MWSIFSRVSHGWNKLIHVGSMGKKRDAFTPQEISKSISFTCSGIFSFLPEVRKLFDIYFFFPNTFVLSEETERLKLFPSMLLFSLVTVKLVVSDIWLWVHLPNKHKQALFPPGKAQRHFGEPLREGLCVIKCCLTRVPPHFWCMTPLKQKEILVLLPCTPSAGESWAGDLSSPFLMLLLSLYFDIFPNVQILKSSYFLLFLRSGWGPIKQPALFSTCSSLCTVFSPGVHFWSRNACSKYLNTQVVYSSSHHAPVELLYKWMNVHKCWKATSLNICHREILLKVTFFFFFY